MRRPGKAVDAAMFAATVRVDGLIERDVRRGIARDDGPSGIAQHLGTDRRWLLIVSVPTVVEAHAPLAIVAAGIVGARASPFQKPRIGGRIKHSGHDLNL